MHVSARRGFARRGIGLIYGWLAYFLFVRIIIYFGAFSSGVVVRRTVDGPRGFPVTHFDAAALAIDFAILLGFCVTHSGLARPGFQSWLARWIDPASVRSTYVWLADVSLLTVITLWRPSGPILWTARSPAMQATVLAVAVSGWTLALAASLTLGHFRLFGMRQSWASFRGVPTPPESLCTRFVYKRMRHPMYLGFGMALWAATTMTAAHLLLSAVLTAYIEVGRRLEERDLTARIPDYDTYRQSVRPFG